MFCIQIHISINIENNEIIKGKTRLFKFCLRDNYLFAPFGWLKKLISRAGNETICPNFHQPIP